MSTPIAAAAPKPSRVNLRRPDIMEAVREQVEQHYRSQIVEKLRGRGGVLEAAELRVRLAKEFGFCYGVERAIDLAYAARKVFPNQPIYILGEIIHNPEVNEQLIAMDIKFLSGPNKSAGLETVQANDVVIIPAFGAEVAMLPARGHNLRRRDECLETRHAKCEGRIHFDYSRQGETRGDAGHQFAGESLPRRAESTGDRLRL